MTVDRPSQTNSTPNTERNAQAMGLIVHVRRPRDHDSTNGGVSRTNDTLLVVESDAAAPLDATMPVMVLEQHALGAVSLRPIKALWVQDRNGPMAGGNFAVGDSKFDA